MKSSHLAVGLVGLLLVGLWYGAGGTNPLPESRAAEASQRVAAPLAHENLSVYFIHGPDAVAGAKVMSLQEALDRELAVVHETSNVNMLAIENRSSEYELFVQSGDIVKGGKQDRMVQSDMLLPPKSGVVPMPAHCVEQGRWTGRRGEASDRFLASYYCAAGKELKYANYSGQQSAVWDNVKRNQDKLNDNLKANVNAAASPTSFQLTLESPAVVAKVTEYETALKAAGEDRDNVVGVVFVVNGQISGAEVYGSNALFRKAWPKLLNAAAVEAVADRTDGPVASAPSAREVARFLASAASAEPSAPRDETVAVTEALNRARRRVEILRAALANGAGAASELTEELRTVQALEALQTEGGQPRELNRVWQAAANPAPNADGTRVAVPALGPLPLALDNAAPDPNPNDQRQVFNFSVGVFGSGGRAAPQPQPASPDGNRLNSNRTENRSTLMVESRDAGRANAVIHRSYMPRVDLGNRAVNPAANPAMPARR